MVTLLNPTSTSKRCWQSAQLVRWQSTTWKIETCSVKVVSGSKIKSSKYRNKPCSGSPSGFLKTLYDPRGGVRTHSLTTCCKVQVWRGEVRKSQFTKICSNWRDERGEKASGAQVLLFMEVEENKGKVFTHEKSSDWALVHVLWPNIPTDFTTSCSNQMSNRTQIHTHEKRRLRHIPWLLFDWKKGCLQSIISQFVSGCSGCESQLSFFGIFKCRFLFSFVNRLVLVCIQYAKLHSRRILNVHFWLVLLAVDTEFTPIPADFPVSSPSERVRTSSIICCWHLVQLSHSQAGWKWFPTGGECSTESGLMRVFTEGLVAELHNENMTS